MYKYETHLHTSPVSACARVGVRENLEFYKEMSYDGVFITNHFLDGNIGCDRSLGYQDKINFCFSDYEQGVEIGKEIGIKVFCGIEMSYGGTDFLIYGLDKNWFLKNSQIMNFSMKEKLALIRENGGYIIQAHPFREASFIDHIRLFPRSIDAVEVINANRSEFENKMAKLYAENYGLYEVAGTDNHAGSSQQIFAGVKSNTPIESELDYISKIKSGQIETFCFKNDM